MYNKPVTDMTKQSFPIAAKYLSLSSVNRHCTKFRLSLSTLYEFIHSCNVILLVLVSLLGLQFVFRRTIVIHYYVDRQFTRNIDESLLAWYDPISFLKQNCSRENFQNWSLLELNTEQ